MIPKECKRIAEVDFPIAVVSEHSAREKFIRHGHPSTLHLWWARRPLASCRSMLLALLLPDPCDPHCPEDFKIKARELLPQLTGKIGSEDMALRKAIIKFIGDFANWDNAANPIFLEVGCGLVKSAHPEEDPLVVDPFAGGGSIPLEALRLGCETFASDLNPVACLILKVMLEDIPRYGPKLAEELRHVGDEIKKRAEQELAELYPKDPDGAIPIVYLWARTVKCESPNCGAEIPLARSFWLCKKKKRRIALRYKVVGSTEGPPSVRFEIFVPENDSEVPKGSVSRAKAACLCCGTILPPERVRTQLTEQRGGADVIFDTDGNRIGGARLLAVVTLRPNEQGRHYRLPEERDYAAVKKAEKRLKKIIGEWRQGGKKGLCPVPDEPTPAGGGSGAGRAFSVQRYGMFRWGDLFTARQKLSNIVLSNAIKKHGNPVTRVLLSFSMGKGLDGNSSLCRWMGGYENPVNQYSRQALPIVWDFCESTPKSTARGVFFSSINAILNVILQLTMVSCGQVVQADARKSPLPSETTPIWFTDPPYYDAIPYSDLSDFFFVWFKRTLLGHPLLHDSYDINNALTPKRMEIVQDETKKDNGQTKDKVWFEGMMAKAFSEGRRVLNNEGIGSVVFAHKTTEG